MKALADMCIYALTDCADMVKSIKEHEGFLYSTFLLPAFAALSEIISGSLLLDSLPSNLGYAWAFRFICIALCAVVNSALIDMAGQFSGNGGKAKQLVAVINLSVFPAIFVLPAVFIFYAAGFGAGVMFFLFSAGAFAWSVLISVQGVSGLYEISYGKSLIICMFPVILFGAAWFVSGILMIAYLFNMIF